MRDIINVTLTGRLVKKPELETIKGKNGDVSVTNFSIACNYDDKSFFFDVAAFGKLAEILNTYTDKGKQIAIMGRLTQDSWVDKASGGKRSKVRIVAEQCTLVGGKPQANDGGSQEPIGPIGGSQEPPSDDEVPF